MSPLPSVCLIGAGSSGITVAKGLKERGIPFDCFDKSDRVGGNWVFGNKNGMSASYRTLHINTSRERMEYSDFPMPKSYPDFPHHTHIAEYFDDYVDHFGLRESHRLRDRCRARRASLTDGTWEITLDTGEAAPLRRARRRQRPPLGRALARARVPRQLRRGRDARPRLPRRRDLRRQARRRPRHGQQRDGHRRRGEPRRPRRPSSRPAAAPTSLPKYVLGRPVDQYPADPRLPWAVRQKFLQALVKFSVGDDGELRPAQARPPHGRGASDAV